MKVTLDIPVAVLRKAKIRAAEQDIPFGQFVTEAVEEKLKPTTFDPSKPWMQMFGGLRHLRKETARIMRIIDQEFETIEPEEWK
jgi:hypothetical protein